MKAVPALFLDRDGVINIDKHYVHKQEDCEFIAGIFDLVRSANRSGYKVFVVTNQAGIARGYYTEQQFLDFSDWMRQQFLAHDAHIDAIYFCPHHPQHGQGRYLQACSCRKPAPGMLQQAQAEYALDLRRSVMIGDNLSDMAAAQAAGIPSRYLLESADTPIRGDSSSQSSDVITYTSI